MVSYEYVAGFVDGEGCISLVHNGTHKTVTLRISVANTNEEIMQTLHSQFGGYLSKATAHKNKPHWKSRYCWELNNTQAAQLLYKIKDYLVVKRKQAALAIEFLEYKVAVGNTIYLENSGKEDVERKFVKNKTEEMDKLENVFKERMHALNKRGISL